MKKCNQIPFSKEPPFLNYNKVSYRQKLCLVNVHIKENNQKISKQLKSIEMDPLNKNLLNLIVGIKIGRRIKE